MDGAAIALRRQPLNAQFGGFLLAAAALLLLVLLLVVLLGASATALRLAAHLCHLPSEQLRVLSQCALRGSVVGRWSNTSHYWALDAPGGRMFIRGEVIPTVTVCPGTAQAAQAPGDSGLEPRRRARRAQACIRACQRVPRPDGDGCDEGKQNRVLDGR